MAAQGAGIPSFGHWDGEDGAQYTEIFAKARKGRSNVTKVVNPNDPEGDPAERKVPGDTTSESRRANIPSFGHWDGEDGVQYTEIFAKARKGGSNVTKVVNPNDLEGDPVQRKVPAASTNELQRANIPLFGHWDGEDYTEIFAKARKGGSNVTKVVNPNDPEGDPAERKVPEATTTIQEQRMSEDSLEFKRNLGSPALNNTHSWQTKTSAGSDHSIEKSPMHKHAQMSGRGSSSPILDRTHGTPGRAHLASSSRGDDRDKGVTVPKFGEWDDGNPTSREGYTQLFNAVREERQGIVRSGNDTPIDSWHSSGTRRANTSKSMGGCGGCCPWLGI